MSDRGIHWMDRAISDMSRDELINIINELAEMVRELHSAENNELRIRGRLSMLRDNRTSLSG